MLLGWRSLATILLLGAGLIVSVLVAGAVVTGEIAAARPSSSSVDQRNGTHYYITVSDPASLPHIMEYLRNGTK